MRAIILSIGISFSVPLESRALSNSNEVRVLQQLDSIQSTQASMASQMSVRFSKVEDQLNQQSEKVSQVDFKLNILYGGAGLTLVILNGISIVGKGLDSIDDLILRMHRKEKVQDNQEGK